MWYISIPYISNKLSSDGEKMIYKEQALGEGKPEHVVDRIVEGRLEKYYQDVCLMDQAFVKDPDKTVKDLLAELVTKCGENVLLRRFDRFVLATLLL